MNMDAAKKKSKKGKKKNKLPETKKATPATATATVEKNVSNEGEFYHCSVVLHSRLVFGWDLFFIFIKNENCYVSYRQLTESKGCNGGTLLQKKILLPPIMK